LIPGIRQRVRTVCAPRAAGKTLEARSQRVWTDNPEIKLLLEFWPHGLKQAGTNWIDLIAALKEKGMIIRQISSEGLIPFQSDSAIESAHWYVNLFASRTWHLR
jgi:hypothetical protein